MTTTRHCISVRLTAQELKDIDRLRGRIPRGTWCRKALFGRPVPVIPEPNREVYAESARWASALSQVARSLNIGDEVDVMEVRSLLKHFRLALLGVSLDEGKNQ